MAESITCQRGLVTGGGAKEPGGGGQAVRSGVRGMSSSLVLRPRAAPFSCSMPTEAGSWWLAGSPGQQQPWGWRMLGRSGWVPVAVPKQGATRGDSRAGLGTPSHTSSTRLLLLASRPALRLSALPSC